jgi:hypothetical protein
MKTYGEQLDRALLAEFSAKLYDTDAMKKLKVE